MCRALTLEALFLLLAIQSVQMLHLVRGAPGDNLLSLKLRMCPALTA